MAKKKKVASVAAAGGQHTARDSSPNGTIEHLKTLNCVLAKEMVERREQIDKLRSELDDLAADHSVLDGIERDVFRLVLSSQLTDAAACGSAELRRVETYLSAEWADAEDRAASLQLKADLVTSKLREAEMRLLAVNREKEGVEMDLKRAVAEKELSWRDLDEKRKEMAYLKESLRSLEQEVARIYAALEVAEENSGKLEEEGKRKEKMLRSVMLEKASLESCLEEKKQMVEKLESDMEEMGSHKEAAMEVLNAENEAIAIKVSTFENQCRYLKDIKDQLQNEVRNLKASLAELKKDSVTLVDEIEMWHGRVEEEFKRSQNKFDLLQKEKLELDKIVELKVGEMNLQMNDLKDNLAKMAGGKDALDQRRGEYEIEISKLMEEKMELSSARKSLEDAHCSFNEKIAKKDAECVAAQRNLKLKEKEVVALRLQVEELMKSKDMVELKHEKLENKMNGVTLENDKRRKQIISLISEKASLEKHLVSAQERLSDIAQQQKASEMTSVRVLALLRNTTTEVLGLERAQENIMSVENGVEVEKDEALQPFVVELKAIKMKIEDMNRDLELLQLTVADRQKSSRRVWKWLCPATTTIFAAVSLVYVARVR